MLRSLDGWEMQQGMQIQQDAVIESLTNASKPLTSVPSTRHQTFSEVSHLESQSGAVMAQQCSTIKHQQHASKQAMASGIVAHFSQSPSLDAFGEEGSSSIGLEGQHFQWPRRSYCPLGPLNVCICALLHIPLVQLSQTGFF